MNSVPERLTNMINLLNNGLLINLQTKEIDSEFILFENILNKTIPSKNEYKLYSFIKQLSIQNKEHFLKLLKEYKIEGFIFWSNLDILLEYLNLSNKFYIKQHYNYYKKNNITHKILKKYTINRLEKKKLSIKEILKKYDEKPAPIDNLNYLDLCDKNENVKLDIFEENYFKEDAELWNRRNILRNNLNKIN